MAYLANADLAIRGVDVNFDVTSHGLSKPGPLGGVLRLRVHELFEIVASYSCSARQIIMSFFSRFSV